MVRSRWPDVARQSYNDVIEDIYGLAQVGSSGVLIDHGHHVIDRDRQADTLRAPQSYREEYQIGSLKVASSKAP